MYTIIDVLLILKLKFKQPTKREILPIHNNKRQKLTVLLYI